MFLLEFILRLPSVTPESVSHIYPMLPWATTTERKLGNCLHPFSLMCGYLQWGNWYPFSSWVIKKSELLKSREERCDMFICLYRTRWVLQEKGNITEAALQEAKIEVTLHLSSKQVADVTVSVMCLNTKHRTKGRMTRHQSGCCLQASRYYKFIKKARSCSWK